MGVPCSYLLKIRLSVTLEDLTLYVAERADKERESMVRQLGAPVDGVKTKLEEMENTIAGFQRTMHLVLSEVDADKERSTAIKVRSTLETMRRGSKDWARSAIVGLTSRLSYFSCVTKTRVGQQTS